MVEAGGGERGSTRNAIVQSRGMARMAAPTLDYLGKGDHNLLSLLDDWIAILDTNHYADAILVVRQLIAAFQDISEKAMDNENALYEFERSLKTDIATWDVHCRYSPMRIDS